MATSLGTQELARRVVTVIDGLSKGLASTGGSGPEVDAILSWLQREDLRPAEVMEVLQHVRTAGYLGRFLNLVHHPRLRAYLREKEVPWDFILMHWEPSVNDTGSFFGGFVAGAGESLTEILRLVGMLAGSLFSAELAKQRQEFWASVRFLVSREFFGLVRQLAASPDAFARGALHSIRADFEEKLYDLQFFEAGRSLGYLLATVATILSALKSLPRILASIEKIAAEIAELTLEQIKRMGVALEKLREIALAPRPVLVTPEGFLLASAGEEIVVLDKTTKPLGKILMSKALGTPGGGSLVKGFLSLSGVARSWLGQHGLIDLARAILKSEAQHIDVIVDAINRYHLSQNFERVAGAYLRCAARTDAWAAKGKRGATFVMRYMAAHFAAVDPRAIVLESRAFSGMALRGTKGVRSAFIRFSDIKVFARRIELKSVENLAEDAMKRAIKQLRRDIIANFDHIDDLPKKVLWVFDREYLQISPNQVLHELKQAIKRDGFFSDHKKLDVLDKALNKVITFWP